MAIGIAASGSSLGGIIYPIVFYRLLDQIDFGWSVRVVGFIALATLLVPLFCMKMRVKPPKARALVDWTLFTDGPFMVFVIGSIVGFIGLYVVLFYISAFAYEEGILNSSLSFYIIPILNASSMFGRTIPNIVADKIGPLNVITPGALVCGVLIFGMIGVHNTGGIVVIALLFGFFSGVFVALPPVCLVSLTKDKTKIGTRIGMAFGIIGFGTLAGGPGGGDLLQRYSNNVPDWTYLWIYGGVADIVACVIFLGVRLWKSGAVVKAKA
ncbi:putative major facilitator superfamily protein [Phaeomoniella chlamydospora]|uniref:Putative major facilitator superfamily protein n=1 Tax=Phaeomoniella chlamydospora TaxID=158046 RepID=A0A0G2E5C7_PHACM|nr:putative major facilitator superfamily protein [Phaeomoniella chlamydospora]